MFGSKKGGVMFKSLGTTEVLIIAVLLLLLFGGRKLPELGKGIGEAIHELKRAFAEDSEDSKKKK